MVEVTEKAYLYYQLLLQAQRVQMLLNDAI